MARLNDDFDLGRITLGTMRFRDKNLRPNEVVNILEKAYDLGIKTHHSSFEYNSYELYLKALASSNCKSKIKHIAKLSSPHFGEVDFSSQSLEDHVDRELKLLNIESIDVLQWLVRSQPINDKDRLSVLTRQKDAIEDCLFRLKKKGKVKTVFSFPYSVKFAEAAIQLKHVDGIISYLNKEELDYEKFANDHAFIAIRPLFAGKLLTEVVNPQKAIEDCLNFVESHQKVLTQIISINSMDQLDTYKELTA